MSLAKTPLELFTDNIPPSSTEYSSETPIGSSFPGLITIETVAVSEISIPSDTE